RRRGDELRLDPARKRLPEPRDVEVKMLSDVLDQAPFAVCIERANARNGPTIIVLNHPRNQIAEHGLLRYRPHLYFEAGPVWNEVRRDACEDFGGRTVEHVGEVMMRAIAQ